jgi:high affinity sulfate transporter 1
LTAATHRTAKPGVLGWLLAYDRKWLSSDLIAGATAAAVVIPQAMGYATVAGLPVEIGLYTCIFPMIVYALLGGSRRLSFSTTSTIVALTGLALTTAGVAGSSDALSTVATLTLMVGVALIFFRLIRLGWVVEAVSEAVVAGLKVGVGLTIVADQLPKLLGIESVEGGFFDDVGNAMSSSGEIITATAIISVVTIVALLLLKRWLPKVPGPLLAVIGGIALAAWSGITSRGVALIAEVPTGLPLPSLPGLDHLETLLPFALAIALMSYFESVTAARISRDPDDPPLDNNQEYVAVGAATIVGSLFQTVPPAGGFSQTQVNSNAGARTQLSELVTAGLAVAVALFLAPVLSDLPEATLGAIVVVSVLGLISLTELKLLWTIDRLEFAIAVATAAAALVFNLLVGVLVGVILTIYFVLRALNHPVVVELRRPAAGGELLPARLGDEPVPGMLVLRIEGGLYTLNVRGVQDEIYRHFEALDPSPEVVLLDVGGTADTSVTVMDTLFETDQHLYRNGSTLWVASIPTRAEAKARRTKAWPDWVARGKIHATVRDAVAAFERLKRPS